MKVFKIDGEEFPVYLTVDSTLYTADSTEITADTTIEDTYPYRIKVIPRVTSQNVGAILKNELLDKTTTLDILYYQYEGEYLVLYFDYPFVEGDSFEITITNLDNPDVKRNTMWRGKGYATMQDDLENYRLIVKEDNNDIIIMD